MKVVDDKNKSFMSKVDSFEKIKILKWLKTRAIVRNEDLPFNFIVMKWEEFHFA